MNEKMKCGDIFLIKNDTFISKLIRWFTRSQYSHCGLCISDDGIHLWHTEFNMGLRLTHLMYPSDKMEVYRVNVSYDHEKLYDFILANIGNKYDFMEIFKVIFRCKKAETDSEYICSELIRAAYRHVGIELVDESINVCTPKDIAESKYLTRIT
ncbi:MAG: YiiX/YebB-like N1pC/P60 family cysteine hydrolase [Peptostreptococcaceae bacterium]